MKAILFSVTVAALVLLTAPVRGQYIYYSKCPGKCEFDHCAGSPDSMYLYVLSSDGQNFMGAHFRLDVDTDPENLASLTPNVGVTIQSGDLLGGMVVSWTPRDLDHYPLLAICWHEPLYVWEHWVRDAMLFQTNGDTLFLIDFPTFAGHFDCFDASFICWHPDTVEVVIGSPFTFEVTCFVSYWDIIGSSFDIIDECNWVGDWNPRYAGSTYCESCPWRCTKVVVSGSVPSVTPADAVSKLTVYPTYAPFIEDSTSFYIRAVPPVSAQPSTWGKIKSVFRKYE